MVTGERLRKWKKANVIRFSFDLNVKADAALIAKLQSVDNRTAYLKQLIQRDIDGGTAEQ